MIRPFAETDLAAVMELWLASNLQAHPFIAPSYWAEYLEEVKSLLPQVEVYVDESGGVVNGFLGLTGKGEIAGLFIAAHARGQGIGTRLMRKAKELYDELSLSVYEKNARAVHFYRREGFQLVEKREDPDTGQVEYRMRWAKSRVDTMKGGAKMGPIVYVGQKNTMHSVIAAAVCNKMAQRWRLAGLCAVSAGLAVQEGAPACAAAVQAAREFGLELSAHRAQPLSAGLIERAGMLVALNRADYDALVRLVPPERVYLQESGKDVSAGDVWACRRSVDQAFDGFQDLWLTLRGSV